MKLKIALDMDDVVADLLENWTKMYKKRVGIPEEQHIPIEQWNVVSGMTELETHEVFGMLNFPGLFYYSKPIDGALVAINKLISNKNYDVYFLTSAAGQTAYYEKLQWIKDNFGEKYKKKTIAVPTGALKNFVGELFDVIVDDCPANITGLCQNGHIPYCILFDQPHNQNAILGVDYHHRARGWDSVLLSIEALHESLDQ